MDSNAPLKRRRSKRTRRGSGNGAPAPKKSRKNVPVAKKTKKNPEIRDNEVCDSIAILDNPGVTSSFLGAGAFGTNTVPKTNGSRTMGNPNRTGKPGISEDSGPTTNSANPVGKSGDTKGNGPTTNSTTGIKKKTSSIRDICSPDSTTGTNTAGNAAGTNVEQQFDLSAAEALYSAECREVAEQQFKATTTSTNVNKRLTTIVEGTEKSTGCESPDLQVLNRKIPKKKLNPTFQQYTAPPFKAFDESLLTGDMNKDLAIFRANSGGGMWLSECTRVREMIMKGTYEAARKRMAAMKEKEAAERMRNLEVSTSGPDASNQVDGIFVFDNAVRNERNKQDRKARARIERDEERLEKLKRILKQQRIEQEETEKRLRDERADTERMMREWIAKWEPQQTGSPAHIDQNTNNRRESEEQRRNRLIIEEQQIRLDAIRRLNEEEEKKRLEAIKRKEEEEKAKREERRRRRSATRNNPGNSTMAVIGDRWERMVTNQEPTNNQPVNAESRNAALRESATIRNAAEDLAQQFNGDGNTGVSQSGDSDPVANTLDMATLKVMCIAMGVTERIQPLFAKWCTEKNLGDTRDVPEYWNRFKAEYQEMLGMGGNMEQNGQPQVQHIASTASQVMRMLADHSGKDGNLTMNLNDVVHEDMFHKTQSSLGALCRPSDATGISAFHVFKTSVWLTRLLPLLYPEIVGQIRKRMVDRMRVKGTTVQNCLKEAYLDIKFTGFPRLVMDTLLEHAVQSMEKFGVTVRDIVKKMLAVTRMFNTLCLRYSLEVQELVIIRLGDVLVATKTEHSAKLVENVERVIKEVTHMYPMHTGWGIRASRKPRGDRDDRDRGDSVNLSRREYKKLKDRASRRNSDTHTRDRKEGPKNRKEWSDPESSAFIPLGWCQTTFGLHQNCTARGCKYTHTPWSSEDLELAKERVRSNRRN